MDTSHRQFVVAVTDQVYQQVELWRSDDELLGAEVERLHQALYVFLDRLDRDPQHFSDIDGTFNVDDGVGFVWATFKNTRLWAGRPDVSLESLGGYQPLTDEMPAHEMSTYAEDDESSSVGAAQTIMRYYATGSAPHSGRLSVTQTEVATMCAVAQYGVDPLEHRITTDAYQLASEKLGMPVDQVKRNYYSAKEAIALVCYVVGALGPTDAFSSETALDQAVQRFRSRFTGQKPWSILVFAARSTLPTGTCAHVNADQYDKAIAANPTQAGRLGYSRDKAPSLLLHEVELQAAAAFGRTNPTCVLSPDCPICAMPSSEEGGKR